MSNTATGAPAAFGTAASRVTDFAPSLWRRLFAQRVRHEAEAVSPFAALDDSGSPTGIVAREPLSLLMDALRMKGAP
jgi:hypothetical protein